MKAVTIPVAQRSGKTILFDKSSNETGKAASTPIAAAAFFALMLFLRGKAPVDLLLDGKGTYRQDRDIGLKCFPVICGGDSANRGFPIPIFYSPVHGSVPPAKTVMDGVATTSGVG